jgi:hypothetical protein
MKTPQGVVKMGNAEVLPGARLPDLGSVLKTRGYQVRDGERRREEDWGVWEVCA